MMPVPVPAQRRPATGECSTNLGCNFPVQDSPQIPQHGSHLTLQLFDTPVHPDRRDHAAGEGHADNFPTEEDVSERKTRSEYSAQEDGNAEQAAKCITEIEVRVQCFLVFHFIGHQYVCVGERDETQSDETQSGGG